MVLLLPQYCHHLQHILETKLYTVICTHVWESETVLDSGFHAADHASGTFFSGTWFLDSNRLTCISGFKAQNLGFRNKNYPNSRFHKQKFPSFHGIPYMG